MVNSFSSSVANASENSADGTWGLLGQQWGKGSLRAIWGKGMRHKRLSHSQDCNEKEGPSGSKEWGGTQWTSNGPKAQEA